MSGNWYSYPIWILHIIIFHFQMHSFLIILAPHYLWLYIDCFAYHVMIQQRWVWCWGGVIKVLNCIGYLQCYFTFVRKINCKWVELWRVVKERRKNERTVFPEKQVKFPTVHFVFKKITTNKPKYVIWYDVILFYKHNITTEIFKELLSSKFS